MTDQSGQTLVQVALMLVVLLGFAALAIDGGMIYSQRRHMQNAADAGALAGARELCLSGSASLAEITAEAYTVDQNGADSAKISIDGNVVDVVAQIQTDTFIAGLLGFAKVRVQADAAAACGSANSSCGLWPIAFSVTSWQNFYSPDGQVCKPQKIIIWNGENENKKPPVCNNSWPKDTCTCLDRFTGQPTDNLCGCYDCDLDNDGEDDFSIAKSENRAWLDLSEAVDPNYNDPYVDSCTKSGCGADELRCHIESDSSAQIRLPQCIAGDNGVKAGVAKAVDDRAGDAVRIALYDETGCPKGICLGGKSYNVIKFGCINVGGWLKKNDPPLPLEPYDDDLYDSIEGPAIVAYVNCTNACTTACGTTDGTPAEPWEVKAVSLIK